MAGRRAAQLSQSMAWGERTPKSRAECRQAVRNSCAEREALAQSDLRAFPTRRGWIRSLQTADVRARSQSCRGKYRTAWQNLSKQEVSFQAEAGLRGWPDAIASKASWSA